MTLKAIISTILLVLAGVLAWLVGMYINCKCVDIRYNRHFLDDEEWRRERELLTQQSSEKSAETKSTNPVKPSSAPMDNAHFFARIHKVRTQQSKH